MDHATSFVNRGMFARVCVEVDLNKPFVSKFMIRRRVRKVEYEWVHMVCFECGIYGHSKDNCPLNAPKKVPVEPKDPPEQGVDVNVQTDVDKERNDRGVQTVEVNPEVLEQFGPWMLVTRKAKKVERKKNTGSANFTKHDPKVQSRVVQSERDSLGKGKRPTGVKTKVGSAVLCALGSDNEDEEGLDNIEENFHENIQADPVNSVKPKRKGRRPDVQISENEVVNGGSNATQ